jgi:hypothetical protein
MGIASSVDLGERLGSADGERTRPHRCAKRCGRETLLTRQIASEPLPASVLFALLFLFIS